MKLENKTRDELILELQKLQRENETLTSAFQTFKDECNQSVTALRKSEKMHRSLFEISPQGVVYQNKEGHIVDANPAAQKILGLTLDQMRGMTSNDPGWRAVKEDGSNFPGGDHPAMVSLKTGRIVKDTLMGVFNAVDKKLHWILINACPLFNQGEDSPYMVYTVFDDVTEQKNIGKKLQDSEIRYRGLFENSPVGIIISRPDGTVIGANPTACRLLGRTENEIRSGGRKIMIDTSDPGFNQALAEREHTGKFSGELTYLRSDDTRFPVYVESKVYSDATGEKYAIIFFQDISERKQYEEALRESKTNMSAMINASDELIVLLSADEKILELNNTTVQRLGRSRESMLGSVVYDLLPPDVVAFRRPFIQQAISSGKPVAFEDQRDNRRMLNSLFPITGETGKVVRLVVYSHDITDLRKAEESLRESVARYRLLAENLTDFIWVYDLETNTFTYQSPSIESLLGYTIEEVQQLGFINTFAPASKEFMLSVIPERVELFRKGTAGSFTDFVEQVHKNGNTVCVEINSHLMINPQTNHLEAIGVARDVTERTRSDAQIAFQSSLLDQVHNGIIVIDFNNTILFWNKFAEKLYQWKSWEAIGKNIVDLLSPEEMKETVFGNFEKLNKEGHWEGDFNVKRKDGTTMPAHIINSYITDEKGNRVSFVGISTDITERKKAEMEITYQNGLITALLDSIPDLIFYKDINGVYLGCNPAFAEYVGKERIDIIGKTDCELFDKETADFFRHHDNRMLEELQPRHNEERIVYPDGRKAMVDTLKTPYKNVGGNLIGILGISRDITRRKQAEEELKESETLLRVAQKIAKMGSWHWDLITQRTVWSENFYDILGVKSSEIVPVYSFFRNCIHPEDLPLLDQTYNRVIDEKVSATFELRLILPDGSVKTIEVRIIPIIENGKIIKFTGVIIDITERKQMEERLVESSAHLLLATRAGGVGVWDYDLINNILVWDDQMLALYGIAKSEFLGTHEAWLRGLHPDYKEKVDAEIQMAIKGEKEFDTEFKVLWPDGSVLDIRALAMVLRDSSGKPIRMIGTNWDITQQKNTEAEIKQKNEELLQLNAQKDKFFSIIAHDLKSPFNSIVGFSEILVEKAEENDLGGIGNYAGIILQSSERALNLLMNLMDWSRSQTGRMEYNPEYFEIVRLIDDVTDLFDDIARRKSIVLARNLPSGNAVFADKAMISTILRNLISNAVKFTRPGGGIIISVNEKPAELIVSVEDNGVGIPKSNIHKLFRIDENITTTGTNKEKGTGLGLILCKEFIEKHSGRIWVESEVGKGSVFSFAIPKNASFTT